MADLTQAKAAKYIVIGGQAYKTGYSSNDYTDDDKTKLTQIEANAQVNVIEGVQLNGTDLTVSADKKVNITIDNTIAKVVASLPATPAEGDENKFHLVPITDATGDNVYTEYLWVASGDSGAWEKQGDRPLSAYTHPTHTAYATEALYQIATDSEGHVVSATAVGLKATYTEADNAVELSIGAAASA